MTNDKPTGQSLTDLRSFALLLASAARKETLRREAQVRVDDKGEDGIFDPVTEADRAAESAMRALISRTYPEHGICGEEFADKTATSRFSWSLDPIDGTRSYMCSLPTWTTLIALLDEGRPVLGVIDAPRLDETYVGSGSEAALRLNREQSPIRASGCKRVAEARFSTTDPFLFGPFLSKVQKVIRAVQVTRFGHDGYAYARLAAGSIDLVIETALKPHDYNALIPVIRGAGGHIGDWTGGSNFAAGAVIAAASRELYDEAVALLAEA
jgi:histidinol phosphatase-like enzyme (inositol monophosphatase family)